MIYVALAAFVAGYALKWLSGLEEIRYLRAELKQTHNQIAHAVIQERAIIPPREEPVEPIKPLSKKLQEAVDQWEDADSRAVEEAKIRQWLAEDWGEKAILRQYGGG